MSKRIITVFGATGKQGGSVVKKFLEDPKLQPEWSIRGVTRDVSSASAKALTAKGVEMVTANVDDKASLVKALSGSAAAFAMTNYWDKADMDLEIQQGKNLADAAKEAGVQHYIWSSLPNVTKVSGGVLKHVYHFDSKAIVEEYVREIGIPATFFLPGIFMSNFPGGMLRPSPDAGGAYRLRMPFAGDRPISLFDSGVDSGSYVKAIVLRRDELLGKRVLASSGEVTGDEMVATFSRLFPEAGKGAKFEQVSAKAYQDAMQGPDFINEELTENMRLIGEFGYFGGESLEPSLAIVEDRLTSWEDHLKAARAFADLK